MIPFEFDADALRNELAAIGRFILVGIVNTAIGYAVILGALAAGADDYAANLTGFIVGLPIAYVLHRWWTFRPTTKPTMLEAVRYALCFVIAFGANLAVITVGRALGYQENPLVQLLAICVYAGLFYVLTRVIVFRGRGPALPSHRN